MNIVHRLEHLIGNLLTRLGFGLRGKLITLFIVIKVIPLILLTVVAIRQFQYLGTKFKANVDIMKSGANAALVEMSRLAVEDSVDIINDLAVARLERMSTDLANRVAEFLYQRDNDIRYIADIEPSEAAYRHFLRYKTGKIVKQREWMLAPDGKTWVPKDPLPEGLYSFSGNHENDMLYNNRPAEQWLTEDRPLYLEMTYIDLNGNELIKITNSDLMDKNLNNVSERRNTFVKAETYFSEAKNLKPGEIYVSDVIGEYVGSRLIGVYNPHNAAERGLLFEPEQEAYAGQENPNGRRFKGLIRWVMPLVRGAQIHGYVTLALDHDHIMEFVDHITPMDERYVEMPSAAEGNYAFIWDYRCRSIAHPRHHSIVGYNAQTGEPQIPWLEESIYNDWKASGKSYSDFIKDVPVFHEQSRTKRPAPELTLAGLVGLDGRYLNNAPQCTGWFDLTKEGGSGSFLILWSSIWKPNTAATIPYYTGNYGKTKRGFGFVAIGAGLEDFQRPAHETEQVLSNIITRTDRVFYAATAETSSMVSSSLINTTLTMGITAAVMIIIVVLIAIWIATVFSTSITDLIKGISRFRSGERHFRFNSAGKDEIGILANSFDDMADSLMEADREPIAIVNRDFKVIFINDIGLTVLDKKLDDVIGRPYAEISFFPPNSPYNPIEALHAGRETEIMYNKELRCYFKGEASYLSDKSGNRIGYIITSVDVTDLMEQQDQLEKAVVEAKLASKHKGNFLARMSHEIRTPMNAIIGMTKIVKNKLNSESYDLHDVKINIAQIETSSQHLLGLLNDILDISKIEAEKIELAIEDMDLLDLAHTVETIIRPRCDEKNINFETQFELLPGISYRGDALRLRQVLINLLGNAVKFTPENGKVSFRIIRGEQKDGKALISFSVQDTGMGIPSESIDSLFKPFQQANSQIAKKYGGTGLGLAISQGIIQMFGGVITINSEEGKGSEFYFSLWLDETESREREQRFVGDKTNILKGKKALLVDDVEINRFITINMLENTGLAIDEADDGLPAVKIFSESVINEYDIIYMDLQMPEMNGYEATTAIRAMDRPDAKNIPIIALTANAFKDDIDKALACGMNAHLAKPMDIEKTIEVTFRLLRI